MAKSNKPSYSLNYRIKEKNGNWGDWREKGIGEWIGIEQVQDQIKMIVKSFPRTVEIKFEKDGKLLDHNGNEIGKSLIFDKR